MTKDDDIKLQEMALENWELSQAIRRMDRALNKLYDSLELIVRADTLKIAKKIAEDALKMDIVNEEP